MTDRLTDQQLDDIEARTAAATAGPWCTDSWEIYQGTEYVPGISEWIGETCRGATSLDQDRADAAFVAHARTDVPALLAEVRQLRTRVAELEEERRLEWLAQGTTPHTPRLCACGHSHHAHRVPAPHSCFAHGQTCPCPAYRQLPHDEAVAQLKLNQQAAAERAAAAAPDPICGDENDGDWCELEPGHDGHHRADTAEWTAEADAAP
jgi:hypothetical protein